MFLFSAILNVSGLFDVKITESLEFENSTDQSTNRINSENPNTYNESDYSDTLKWIAFLNSLLKNVVCTVCIVTLNILTLIKTKKVKITAYMMNFIFTLFKRQRMYFFC